MPPRPNIEYLSRGVIPDAGYVTQILNENKQKEESISSIVREEAWYTEGLTIVVVGASGDLAKRKTYPSLFDLYSSKLLPRNTVIWGYARSKKTHESLRSGLKPFLLDRSIDEDKIDAFLSTCFYHSGQSYGDLEAYKSLNEMIIEDEYENVNRNYADCIRNSRSNRLFYFAIPPNRFGEAGLQVKKAAMATNGWTRVVVEKPFGRDLQTCKELLGLLARNFEEDQLYRIDHYLGKEMIQNLLVFRFSNSWMDWLWHRNAISHVEICFKESIGTQGRGGYFDQYGIIRDIIQNHLMQVLTVLTMEPPNKGSAKELGVSIRDAKVAILNAMPPIPLSDCLLGQYKGYTDDPTIEDKSTTAPTFAAVRCFINTPRWEGVPFIMIAGKALDERKAEITVHFKKPKHSSLFGSCLPQNKLTIKIQPLTDAAISLKTNIKSPGFQSSPVSTDLQFNYNHQFSMASNNPDAYTRLILDVLRGREMSFVRDDELRKSWEIFTPLLQQIEQNNIKPFSYMPGQSAPDQFHDFFLKKASNASKL